MGAKDNGIGLRSYNPLDYCHAEPESLTREEREFMAAVIHARITGQDSVTYTANGHGISIGTTESVSMNTRTNAPVDVSTGISVSQRESIGISVSHGECTGVSVSHGYARTGALPRGNCTGILPCGNVSQGPGHPHYNVGNTAMTNRLHNAEPTISYTDILEAYERLKDSLEDQELKTIFRYMSELTGVSEDGIVEDLSQRDYDA